jgi:hypothetical protein
VKIKLFTAFLFCLASSIANAEYKPFKLEKTVSCGPAAKMLEFLERDYNEKQVWVGIDMSGPNESYIALLMDRATGKWTVVQYNTHVACILGSGIRGTPPPVEQAK